MTAQRASSTIKDAGVFSEGTGGAGTSPVQVVERFRGVMNSEKRGWGAFGAFSLGGELPRERVLSRMEVRIAELESVRPSPHSPVFDELSALRAEWAEAARQLYGRLEPWETVCIARHPSRPVLPDYLHYLVHDFCELHGDRVYGDDRAIITGLGCIDDHRVLIVGHNRGHSLEERVACHFGCAHPEGYRKAHARMRLAAKFRLPIVSLIDTPGAYPGTEAEQRGVAQAIAANLSLMPRLRVPIIAVVIGEGGSGGALGIGVADCVAMLEHSVFSVISPEGCAAILWKTSAQAQAAASALKMRAPDLKNLGMIDEIISEPLGGAHRNHAQAAAYLGDFLRRSLEELKRLPVETLLQRRYNRLRCVGASFESVANIRSAETPRAAM